jgi:glycine cleavage system aminomethyltransferase T
MPNGKGGIIDDLIIYRISEDHYFLVVNASNIDKDWNWISSHNDLGVEMNNLSDDYSLLAIQGPKAAEAMQSLQLAITMDDKNLIQTKQEELNNISRPYAERVMDHAVSEALKGKSIDEG